jgi:hypothetical protein
VSAPEERRPRPCIGPPECACPTCLRAMVAEHAPHLLDDDHPDPELTPDTKVR